MVDSQVPDDVIDDPNDEFDSSDDDPLIRLVPDDKKKWKPSNIFQHSATSTNADAQLVNNDVAVVLEPFEYFSKYLDADFFEEVALFTNMKEVKISGKSLETTPHEISKFFACSMLIGIYGLPRLRMYWGRQTKVPIVADNMSRNRYFQLRARLKVVDDDVISKECRLGDRFWKIRPMLDKIQRGCRANERTMEVSIDEQMIPFHGQVSMRQYVKNKPNPVGLKNFVMATPSGIPLDFQPYEGKGTSVESALVTTPEKLDVGGRFVLKLCDTLPPGATVYTDRYFTSVKLIDTLLSRSIGLTGTLMKSRIPKQIDFSSDNKMKKEGRGTYEQVVREDSKIAIVKWFDTRPVHLASSVTGSQPEGECKRWSKPDAKYIQVKQPAIVKFYNAKMGGIDLLDRVIGKYPMRYRTNKWTIRAIYHFIDFSVAAGWLMYRKDAQLKGLPKKEILDYLDFKFTVAKNLMLQFAEVASNEESRARPAVNVEAEDDGPTTSKKARKPEHMPDKRFSTMNAKHLPDFRNEEQKCRSKCRNPGCKKLTFVCCTACKIFLCCSAGRNCFLEFHKK